MLQTLIATPSLDAASWISILSFAVAIPLLASMVLIYHAQIQYRYASYPWYLTLMIYLGQGGAFMGVFAAFWHVSWMAAIVLAISALGGLLSYALYMKRLAGDNTDHGQSPPAHGDTL